ncbi:MAG: pyridoxamine 5'-phosphate oxidase family protein [Bacteroidales bacterium]|nr:pyridoxamine 5'-phosphate oxidase family protein [Bacteroidales bacterium]
MIDQRILDFIGEHHVLTVACTTLDGEPWCANAFYVFDPQEEGFIITSEAKTWHAQLFLENPKVSGTIVLETEEVGKIRGLQFSGTVRRCDGGLFDRCRLKYLKRFPYAVFKGGEVWMICPDLLKYTDNRLGFGKKLFWQRQKNQRGAKA